jgi:sialidase-1
MEMPQTSQSDWYGYNKQSFVHSGHGAYVVIPKIAAPGNPWVWRTSFPDFHAEIDVHLLGAGFHVAYIDVLDMLGSDRSLDIMERFRDLIRYKYKLAEKCCIEGVSRGGMHAYRYTHRHPDQIACIYCDTPVMNLASWPKKWPGSQREWQDAKREFGFAKDEDALQFRSNPIDLAVDIAKAGIPMRHTISLSDEVVPAAENTLEANRRLAKIGKAIELVTVEKGTPESNGHHFALPKIDETARWIQHHAEVNPTGVVQHTLRGGLGRAFAAFRKTKRGTVGFLGGSITYNGGWRDYVMSDLKRRFPDTQFTFVAAGIPSMGSVPHAFRVQSDLLDKGPFDLVFIEAAVNDRTNHPKDATRVSRAMEGVVRHIRRESPLTDIVQLHFAMEEFYADFAAGRMPGTLAIHERVANHYGNPSVNIAKEVWARSAAGQFTWANGIRDVHPSPFGGLLYGRAISRLFDDAEDASTVSGGSQQKHPLPKALDRACYERGHYETLQAAQPVQGFRLVERWQPQIPAGTRDGFVNVPALTASKPGDTLRFRFSGTAVGLAVAAGPDAGILRCRIDNGKEVIVDTFTAWSGGLYLPWVYVLADDLKPGTHELVVTIDHQKHAVSKGTAVHIMHLCVS